MSSRWSNVKWVILIIFFLAVFIQLLMNFSVIKTNIQGVLTNNIYISETGLQNDISLGKFRIKIDNLATTVKPNVPVALKTTLKPTVMASKTPYVTVTSTRPSTVVVTTKPTVPKEPTVTVEVKPDTEKGLGLKMCPVIPPGLVGRIDVDLSTPSWIELHKKFADVQAGGRWWPKECKSRSRIAIIIPYRNREAHLKTLTNNLHRLLQKQQLDYGIYVIEEAEPTNFNRAMLFNIGYVESLKKYPYQCFAFHDVDLLPENDKNLYTCPDQPRHMSVSIDKFQYRLPYASIFGGVGALTKEQMIKVNGFSNKFFGWGGEDDDMSDRVRSHGYQISRYPNEIARYKMIKHGNDKGNKANPLRMRLLHESRRRFKTDGINSLKGTYTVIRNEDRKMYTLITVQIDEAAVGRT